MKTDSEKLLEIIRNDPSSLRQKRFLLAEVEKIPLRETLSSAPETESEMSYSLEDVPRDQAEPRAPEEAESEPPIAKARYTRGVGAHQARSLSKKAKKALGITEESLLKVAIEEHESEIKKNSNVFSLLGKVWFVKFAQKEWGIYPDREKYKYIANLLSLSDENLKDNDLKYSIHNVDLLVKVKGRKITAEYPNYDEQDDLGHSELAETLSSEELEKFREFWNGLLEELREARKSRDQKLVKETQNKINRYRSDLLNDYGIQVLISKDESRIFIKTLYRASKEIEKVRQIVKNQINNAIKDFEGRMPMFWRHLRNSLKTKSHVTLYSPENRIAWHVSM